MILVNTVTPTICKCQFHNIQIRNGVKTRYLKRGKEWKRYIKKKEIKVWKGKKRKRKKMMISENFGLEIL